MLQIPIPQLTRGRRTTRALPKGTPASDAGSSSRHLHVRKWRAVPFHRDQLIEQARPILEQYRRGLVVLRRFDAAAFEMELRSLWKIGFQEFKPCIIAIGRDARYREVAAYYMERINA